MGLCAAVILIMFILILVNNTPIPNKKSKLCNRSIILGGSFFFSLFLSLCYSSSRSWSSSPACWFRFFCLHPSLSPNSLHLSHSPFILLQLSLFVFFFCFFIWIMTSSPKIVGGKGLRALSGFDNTCLPHLFLTLAPSLSLFGPYLAATTWFSVKLLCEVITVWSCGSLEPLFAKTLRMRCREKKDDEESLAVFFSLCLRSWLSSRLSLSFTVFCPYRLFYFITYFPCFPCLSFSLPLSHHGFVGAEWK